MTFEWVEDPPSKDIADIFNTVGVERCPHGNASCYSLCGVWLAQRSPRGPRLWEPIPQEERRLWCTAMDEKGFVTLADIHG